jgi:hypothetical protein
MNYPASLQPTTSETMTLPSGRSVSFPKATPTFALWRGNPVDKTYGKKTVLDFNGRPAFAELVILWTLQNEGWQGVWVDSFRRAFRTGYWDSPPQKSLPQKPSSLSEEIWNLAKTTSGAWDVSGMTTGSCFPNPRKQEETEYGQASYCLRNPSSTWDFYSILFYLSNKRHIGGTIVTGADQCDWTRA